MVLDTTFLEWHGFIEKVNFEKETNYKSLSFIVYRPIPKLHIPTLVDYAKKFERVFISISWWGGVDYELTFLESFPFLYGFGLGTPLFDSFDQLSLIPSNIESLSITELRTQKLSLSFIGKFKKLKSLTLTKHKKDIDVISELSCLEKLDIKSIAMPSLDFIGNKSTLKSLRIALGGTKNIELLPEYQQLRYLELWAINKITNIDALASTYALEEIYLDQLSCVEEAQSLRQLTNLSFLHLCRMKRLKSIKWIADAPNLTKFSITQTDHLSPEAFLPLTRNKSLREASIYIGRKHSFKVREMLGLPEINYN